MTQKYDYGKDIIEWERKHGNIKYLVDVSDYRPTWMKNDRKKT